MRMIRNLDRWPKFCEAVQRWRAAREAAKEPPVSTSTLGAADAETVPSAAGGLAQRCTHAAGGQRCANEVHS
eukprot:6753604-Alexandrium_andersonii.AAC.1